MCRLELLNWHTSVPWSKGSCSSKLIQARQIIYLVREFLAPCPTWRNLFPEKMKYRIAYNFCSCYANKWHLSIGREFFYFWCFYGLSSHMLPFSHDCFLTVSAAWGVNCHNPIVFAILVCNLGDGLSSSQGKGRCMLYIYLPLSQEKLYRWYKSEKPV